MIAPTAETRPAKDHCVLKIPLLAKELIVTTDDGSPHASELGACAVLSDCLGIAGFPEDPHHDESGKEQEASIVKQVLKPDNPN